MLNELGKWYHRIDLGDGRITPGDRDQSLTFELYADHLPQDLSGLTVLDLGANACGLSLEFAKRGANVTALEQSSTYLRQAKYVIEHFGFQNKIKLFVGDIFDIYGLGKFDIICYVGLSYHLRYPQLALDLLSNMCKQSLLTSTQTIPNNESYVMRNRISTVSVLNRNLGDLQGYEPTENLFLEMIASAGFQNPKLLSTSPHANESPGRFLGNRAYFYADAPLKPVKLPFINNQVIPWNGK